MDHFYKKSYTKIVASLLNKYGTHNIDLIEECVQEAFIKSSQLWPLKGVPEKPLNWLITVSSNLVLNEILRTKKLNEIINERFTADLSVENLGPEDVFLNEDLKLLFLCCHPAIAPEIQLCLILKNICGLGNKEIAKSLFIKEETVAQRIVRAKRYIKEEKLKFEIPDEESIDSRVSIVLLAIYVLFNEGYSRSEGALLTSDEFCKEAIYLVEQLEKYPLAKSSEVFALHALFCFQFSRLHTRYDSSTGVLLDLKNQDRDQWDKSMILAGVRLLKLAMNTKELSSFHIEAGIAYCHVGSKSWEETNWTEIVHLYEILDKNFPSPVVKLNKAAAMLFENSVREARALVESLREHYKEHPYSLFHALDAEISLKECNGQEAIEKLELASLLTHNQSEKNYYLSKIKRVKTSLHFDS